MGKGTPLKTDFQSEDLDPELIILPRKRSAISPISSLALILFCVYALFKLWPNAVYSLEESEAKVIDVSKVSLSDVGHYVALTSPLDFSNPIVMQKSPARLGSRWAKMLGSDGRVWAALPGDVWQDKGPSSTLKGRLVRLERLPHYNALGEYLKSKEEVRVVSGAEFLKSKNEKTQRLNDVYGDSLVLTQDQQIEIKYRQQGRLLIRAPRTDEYSDEPIWRATLSSLGFISLDQRPIQATENEWTYEMTTAKSALEVNKELKNANLYAATSEPKRQVLSKLNSELSSFENEITTKEGDVLDVSSVDAIVISQRSSLREDSMALIVSEKPSMHRNSLYGVIFVSLALCFLLWNFFRELKYRTS